MGIVRGLRMSAIRAAPLLLALGAVALALLPLLASPNLLMRGDVALYFYPYWEAAARATREGRLPFWNPDLFTGIPFLANPQVGFFYPPNRALSWLPVPLALKLSILMHALWAAGGMFGLARWLRYRTAGATAAAVAYAAGGYFLAQAEHINQFQALAWLPWMAWAWAARRPVRLGLAGAMQILCGHAQTVVLSWAALLILLAPSGDERRRLSGWIRAWSPGALGGALALGLSAFQWVPSLLLAQASIRAGGLPLNEALSFSLSPVLLGRSLLPGREAPAFTEFTAYVGVLGLLALAAGIRQTDRRWAVIAGAGLLLALGAYNPIYPLLLELFPPLRAFRVPARWLALWAFGAALGIGAGFDRGLARLGPRRLALWALGSLALMGLALAASPIQPPGMTGSLGPVKPAAVGLWVVALIAGGLLAWRRPSRAVWAGLWLAELMGAAWGLPVNRLLPPEAWSDPRLPALVLRDLQRKAGPEAGRILSVVDLRFDPGDLGEWRSVFGGQLSPEAFEEFLVATKYKEALVANLPMARGLPTVDGYDGGVLPLRRYIELARRFVPTDRLLRDGRLWETLPGLPEARWLQLLGVRWIVTDRLRDEWIDGVFYDRGIAADACGAEPVEAGPFPPLEATELRLLVTSSLPPGTKLGVAELQTSEGDRLELSVAMGERNTPVRVRWGMPKQITGVRLRPASPACAEGGWRVEGGALVDERTGAFQALVLSPGGAFARRYAGDVKIYEFRKALPRLYGVCQVLSARGEAEAMDRLADPAFDPSRIVVIEGETDRAEEPPRPCAVKIQWLRFTPEVREAEVRLEGPGWLVLMESFDPGWRATVDGQAVPVRRANGLFQAIAVPGGVHRVRWEYQPAGWGVGIGLTALSLFSGVWIWGWRRARGKVPRQAHE
ncbi:MAG: YfhO family protein [Thermoflexus sp.]|uniref:YfhO family protein n=1 Tax=Thermoflexus sp. TaxID=1969742 RepID=UPI0025EA0D91|nr:YfhO family protein [Thermoflexus sp.]MCS6964200.1 YfhO family protein [Thermoflexus sp.]